MHQKTRKVSWLSIAAATIGLVASQPAMLVSAHQSPSGCNANRFNISITKDRTEVYQGQTLTYTVTASNVDFESDVACDITDATVSVRLPAPDGSATGSTVTLATSQDYLAGSATTFVGSAQYVVNVNPGVTDIVAEARAEGTLHDAPVNHAALIVKTIGTSVVAAPASDTSESETTTAQATALPTLPNTGTARRP